MKWKLKRKIEFRAMLHTNILPVVHYFATNHANNSFPRDYGLQLVNVKLVKVKLVKVKLVNVKLVNVKLVNVKLVNVKLVNVKLVNVVRVKPLTDTSCAAGGTGRTFPRGAGGRERLGYFIGLRYRANSLLKFSHNFLLKDRQNKRTGMAVTTRPVTQLFLNNLL